MNSPILKAVKFGAIASGIKADNILDLSVILLPKNSKTAGVFTQNIFCAAPVWVAKNHLNNAVRALVINSGNANAGTGVGSGSQGLKNAYQVCNLVAQSYGITAEQVLPFSTGVIGEQLPMACFEQHIAALVTGANEGGLMQVAKAIMTTDTSVKLSYQSIEYQGKTVNIVGIAKGSGMICPNMATMLSFIITDAKVQTQAQLQTILTTAVNQSFNRITIDGDTSTNDGVTLSATGQSGVNIKAIEAEFSQAINALSHELAMKIVKDGEGATKFVKISVSGGQTQADCLEVAYTIAHSPLVKTALFASDANIGRLLMAVGRAKVEHVFTQACVDIKLNGLAIIKHGLIAPKYTEQQGSIEIAKANIDIAVSIGHSEYLETVWTTDLSYEYIKINADYRS